MITTRTYGASWAPRTATSIGITMERDIAGFVVVTIAISMRVGVGVEGIGVPVLRWKLLVGLGLYSFLFKFYGKLVLEGQF